MASSQSTVTVQQIVDNAVCFGDIAPIFNVAGYSGQPSLTIATDVMNAIMAVPFPHKFNEAILPPFYTNSYQQDTSVVNPDGSSITNLAWLERGTVFDINSLAVPKPYRFVECGRQLPQASGTFWNSATNNPLYLVNFFPNYMLYYGTWGAGIIGTSSLDNNPQPGSIYTNPLGVAVTAATWLAGSTTFTLDYIPNGVAIGTSITIVNVFPATYNNSYVVTGVNTSLLTVTVTGPASNPGAYESGGVFGLIVGGQTPQTPNLSMPRNPITQIRDANGNLLLLTQYGTEGTTAPLAIVSATPGTVVSGSGATTQWTVLDPNGVGFRILPVPSQTGVVWQFNLIYQKKPVRFTSLSQTLDPIPDEFEPHFRAGFIAQCYRYSPEAKVRAKFTQEWAMWLTSLESLRAKQDRELEENMFQPDRGIMGPQVARNRWVGGAWPFNYPNR